MRQGFKQLSILAARAADKKKAEEILLLDVHRLSTITDYLLLASIHSPAHLEAVETEISNIMESSGVAIVHKDGAKAALWRVLDYGGLMVHLMHPEARAFYQIDKLYHGAPKRRWEEEPAHAGAERKYALGTAGREHFLSRGAKK